MIRTRKSLLVIGDGIALLCALALMIAIRFSFSAESVIIVRQVQFFCILFVGWIIIFFIFDLYSIRRINPNPTNIGFLFIAIAVNILLSGISFYFYTESGIAPKTNLILVGVFAFVLITIWRRLFYLLLSKRYSFPIAFVGTSTLFEPLKEVLDAHPHLGTVTGHYKNSSELPSGQINLFIVESIPPNEIVALEQKRKDADILTLSQAYEMIAGKIPLLLMNESTATTIATRPKNEFYILYRLIEILIAVLILIISTPFLIIASIAIAIEDGGPILYRQTRVGKQGAHFFLYKFRSMHPDAEKNGVQWAQLGDNRITRTGKILRATHIDEIPQMYNILRGDIALVGPRPERPELVEVLEKEIPYYYLRHVQKPGFTGWAQIKYRYARTVDDSREKFEYDLYYLKNQHPLLDIGIIIKTLQIIFTHA